MPGIFRPAAALECDSCFIGVDCWTEGEPLDTMDVLRPVDLFEDFAPTANSGATVPLDRGLVVLHALVDGR